MSLKSECVSYLEKANLELNKEFPKNEQLSDSLFMMFSDFVNDDYEGISDNKIDKLYLCLLKDLIVVSFENNASKSFMRGFFKSLNNKSVTDYLSSITKTQTINFKSPLNAMVNEFVYWQESDHKKELKLNHLINRINSWM